ncbi:MAG TPA: hypothetical protein VEF07_03630 [Candidatus Binataceae bacterium]|nr:hypothetical protein [Candidatus Binataceae bacterium]
MDYRSDCAPTRFWRTSIACAALFVLSIPNSGCSLFHHDSPTTQQKFIEALERGNGPEANQIWLHMNEQERADWSHSIGMKPNVSKENIQADVMRHFQEQQAAQNGDDASNGSDGSSTTQIEEGNIDSQVIEMPGVEADPGAGLQSLPGMPGADSPASPEPITPPM